MSLPNALIFTGVFGPTVIGATQDESTVVQTTLSFTTTSYPVAFGDFFQEIEVSFREIGVTTGATAGAGSTVTGTTTVAVCPLSFTLTATLVIPLKLRTGVILTCVPLTKTREIPSPTGRFTSARDAAATVGAEVGVADGAEVEDVPEDVAPEPFGAGDGVVLGVG